MSEQKLFAGQAVRRVRRAQGLTQTVMADALGISASYFNLIERNQRPLTAMLMLRLAERFDFDARRLSGTQPGGGAEAIRRRLSDPLFDGLDIDRSQIDDWIAAPLFARSKYWPTSRPFFFGSKGTYFHGCLLPAGGYGEIFVTSTHMKPWAASITTSLFVRL